jgi:transposase
LLTLREILVKQRAGHRSTLKEQKRIYTRNDNKLLLETQEKMIKFLTKQIRGIELEMDKIIKSNQQLKQQYDLIVSIKGIGNQTALFMILTTNGLQNLLLGENLLPIVVLLLFLILQEPV